MPIDTYKAISAAGLKQLIILFLAVATQTGFAQGNGANSACGALYSPGQYGPFDFRTDKDKLPLVLNVHFTPVVEALIRGATAVRPAPDIDYTLRAIPNHPNALFAMMTLGEREKTSQPQESRYTVECWFQRALQFRPDDTVVRMIYTTFLIKNNRKPEGLQQLDAVLAMVKDNPFTYFNVGLLYLDIGEPDKALIPAHKAMELGLSKTELRDRLVALGKWKEPAATVPTETTAPPAITSPKP